MKIPRLLVAAFLAGLSLLAPATLTAQNSFVAGASMEAGHDARDSAVLLDDGRVFYIGGSAVNSGLPKTSLEFFNPINGQFNVSGNMVEGRIAPAVAKLNDGRVFIAGGFRPTGFTNVSAEIFNPANNTLTRVADLPVPRYAAATVTLADGRVAMFGGFELPNWNSSNFGRIHLTVVLYDPATNTYSSANMPMRWHSMNALLLANGKVLLSGGWTGDFTATAAMYLYDPANHSFTTLPNMSVARSGQRSTLLPDGRVLLSGGQTGYNAANTASCDIFDPAVNLIVQTIQMSTPRAGHNVVKLLDGTFLFTSADTPRAERYNPSTNAFSSLSAQPALQRAGGSSLRLLDGRILLSGGRIPYPSAPALQAEYFTWANNQPPVANAGPDIIAYVGVANQGAVTLNGSASSDPEGQPLTYGWSGPFGTVSGVAPSVTLPLGIHTITLTVADSLNATSTATVRIAVVQGTDVAGYIQLQAQVQTLTTQVADLNSQLTAANASIATLTAANALLTQKNASLVTLLQALLVSLDDIKAHATAINTLADQKKADINQALNGN